jgi:hypothetical protein
MEGAGVLRKLKLLGVLLAMMAVVVSSTASPALARHWDYYDDPWGQCGWNEVWEWSYVFERWDFEGYEYDCHRYWSDFDRWDDDDHRNWDDDDHRNWDDDDHRNGDDDDHRNGDDDDDHWND